MLCTRCHLSHRNFVKVTADINYLNFVLFAKIYLIHQNNAPEHKSYYCMVCPPVLVRCKLFLRSSGLPVQHEIQAKSYPQIQNRNKYKKMTYFVRTVGYICKFLVSFNSRTITNGKYGKIILQTTQLALDNTSRLELSSATTPDGHFSVPKLSRPRCIDQEVKPILRSDEEKELRVTSARGQRKLVVKNLSQTFVKNAFYFL